MPSFAPFEQTREKIQFTVALEMALPAGTASLDSAEEAVVCEVTLASMGATDGAECRVVGFEGVGSRLALEESLDREDDLSRRMYGNGKVIRQRMLQKKKKSFYVKETALK